MRSPTMRDATRPLASRTLLLGGFTFLMAVVGLASLAAVAIAGTSGGLRRGGVGGETSDARPRLVAVGDARVRAPGDIALLQLLLGTSPFTDTFGPVTRPADGSAPGAAERDAAQPVVRALHAAGVVPSDIRIVGSPALPSGYFGGNTGLYGIRLDVTVRDPTLDTLNALVNAAGGAALANERSLAAVGVAYRVDDCAPLTRQARERANEAARANAQAQAAVLGVPLGALLLASEAPAEISGGEADTADGCAPPLPSPASPFGDTSGLGVPRFDPAVPAEAVVRSRVSLTFALPDD